MNEAWRTPPAYHRPGPDQAPLDYPTCRVKGLGLATAYHRKLHGLGIEEAATYTDLTPGELTAIEAGTATPTLDTVFLLADVYRTDAAELVGHALRIAARLFDDRWRPHGAGADA